MDEQFYNFIVDQLVEKGLCIIEDALPLELCNQLLQTAKHNQNFKQAGISASSHLHINTNRRRDKILWLNETTKAQSNYLAIMQQLQEKLNRELFLGIRFYESHFAKYSDGDFYEKHLDAFKNSKNRVVTTVYYLNNEWCEKDGGELFIYDKEDLLIQKVLPKHNTLVVFLSEDFPHEVVATNKTRYSIAGWFRIDKHL